MVAAGTETLLALNSAWIMNRSTLVKSFNDEMLDELTDEMLDEPIP